jgi:hypothetical protein
LKRVTSGIICRQEGAKVLEFEGIIPIDRYSLRPSLAFQTTSKSMLKTVALAPLPQPTSRRAGGEELEKPLKFLSLGERNLR